MNCTNKGNGVPNHGSLVTKGLKLMELPSIQRSYRTQYVSDKGLKHLEFGEEESNKCG